MKELFNYDAPTEGNKPAQQILFEVQAELDKSNRISDGIIGFLVGECNNGDYKKPVSPYRSFTHSLEEAKLAAISVEKKLERIAYILGTDQM